LLVNSNGTLYGATRGGGSGSCSYGCGTIFQLTPPPVTGSTWTQTLLFSFDGQDGQHPQGGLVMDQSGNLYGVTPEIQIRRLLHGTVFQLQPPSAPGGAWTQETLHIFGRNSGDGSVPSSLVLGNNGELYGTTQLGGTACSSYGGCGTVFEVKPPATLGGTWSETVLYSFGSQTNDGVSPFSAPAIDASGNLYGATGLGGSHSQGTVWRLARPVTPGGAWRETVLYSFTGQNGDGIFANGVILGHDGVLYGTTAGGGVYMCNFPAPQLGCGTIFQLSPPATSNGAWTETVLYSFTGQNGDGFAPSAAPGQGPNRVLFGTTSYGGSHNVGTIYQLRPPAAPGGAWRESVLYSLGAATGINPYTPLIVSNAGVFFGTTQSAVFQLVP
jgi:uncharacterized repeat protein (TIGR03803 family)